MPRLALLRTATTSTVYSGQHQSSAACTPCTPRCDKGAVCACHDFCPVMQPFRSLTAWCGCRAAALQGRLVHHGQAGGDGDHQQDCLPLHRLGVHCALTWQCVQVGPPGARGGGCRVIAVEFLANCGAMTSVRTTTMDGYLSLGANPARIASMMVWCLLARLVGHLPQAWPSEVQW
jgi:hypothetical protein